MVAASAALIALSVCAALASARPLVAKRDHPRLAIVHRTLAPVTKLAPGDSANARWSCATAAAAGSRAVVLRVKGLSHSLLGSGSTALRFEDRALLDEVDEERAGTRIYKCHGKHWASSAPLAIGSRRPLRLRRLSARAGRTDHLRLTLGLPLRAGNEVEHRLSRLVYTFTGAAR